MANMAEVERVGTPLPADDIVQEPLPVENLRKYKEMVVLEVDENQPCKECGPDRCPGFASHSWRNVCVNCRCPRTSHQLYHEDFVNIWDRLGWQPPEDPSLRVSKEHTLQEGFTWVPPGLPSHKIQEYMDQLDNNKIPLIGEPGELYRAQQLIIQLPKQDFSVDYCHQLQTTGLQKAFGDFRTMRDSLFMDVALLEQNVKEDVNCHMCEGEIDAGDMAVCAKKMKTTPYWHPACFLCCVCEELLVDMVYCFKDDQIYCERHYAETIRPRCAACDELIFSGEYTKAMEQDFHTGHFSCWNCDLSLTGHRYILRDEHPFCIKCYENLFANSCEECKKPIGTDSKDLSYKEKHWHETCFKCCDCQRSLVDQPFASKEERLYCADCHDNNFAARCDGCGNIFRAGMKKFEFRGKQWHEECFSCSVCKQPIGNQRFIPRETEYVCVPCYEEQFAQRCLKCNGVINKGGITYKSHPFHRDCFTCTNCNKILAGEKFTSREDAPYCADCFGEMFAKKCCRCTRPITGLGGTKFISFDDRHWHSDCFGCYRCNASLVGRGFLTNEQDILCPECGKSL